uniref:C-type lectin domain-containing protein n=1 Tax=Cyprinus carpio TaxID=7962 RepID=A0A8C1MCI8_CYPCA
TQLFLFFTFTASCDLYRFVLIEEPKTWPEAHSYCRENYTDLVTVQSDADRAKLKEAANVLNFSSVAWIGFYKDPWLWSYQNTVISYEKWDYSEPEKPNTNEACVFVNRYRQWHDTSCTVLKYLFCQTGKTLYKTFVQL